MQKQNAYLTMLLITAAIAGILLLFLPPIKQSVLYHSFSDEKELMGIPNFLNVVSNLPFLIVGILGLNKARFAFKASFPNGFKCSNCARSRAAI